MANQISKNDVAKRRAEFPNDSKFLSDWQIHTAHLVHAAIMNKATDTPYDSGPRYIPFPTGSGKTIGAIWGIVKVAKDDPSIRICFFTPYQIAVDSVYDSLVKHLGTECVGRYHGAASVDKAVELAKQVVVLTHQFVQYNKGTLDDRDIFVVDEAIYATAEVSLDLADFANALNWSTSNAQLTSEFEKAHKYAVKMYDTLEKDDDKRFFAAPELTDRTWAKTISELVLSDKLGQTVSNRQAVLGVQVFCEALLMGLVFIDRGRSADATKYKPTFNAAILGLPQLEKTIVLTATGGLIYDNAGTIHESNFSKHYGIPATYETVTLIDLPDPKISEQYKAWGTPTIRTTVIDYLDWLLKEMIEPEAYVTMPLAVYGNCLRGYFNLGNGDLAFPLTVEKHGKKLHLSHHQLSIGSNEFKDCPAVIYLWPNHLPKSALLQVQTALDGKPVTDQKLTLPNTRKQSGSFARMRDGKYVDNIIQQMGRGNIRQITGDGKAGKMTAYLLVRPDDLARLNTLMPDVITSSLSGYGSTKKPTGRLARITNYLNDNKGADLKVSEVAKATNIEAKYIKQTAIDNEWEIEKIGYVFQLGERGKGKSASFKWIK